MCAGMIISLYKYVKLCTGGQGGETMGNVRGMGCNGMGIFYANFKIFYIFFIVS